MSWVPGASKEDLFCIFQPQAQALSCATRAFQYCAFPHIRAIQTGPQGPRPDKKRSLHPARGPYATSPSPSLKNRLEEPCTHSDQNDEERSPCLKVCSIHSHRKLSDRLRPPISRLKLAQLLRARRAYFWQEALLNLATTLN